MTRVSPTVIRARLLQLALYWAFCALAFYVVVIWWRPDIGLGLTVLLPTILLALCVLFWKSSAWRWSPPPAGTHPDAARVDVTAEPHVDEEVPRSTT